LFSVPVIWIFFPETKGRSLEDMDELFSFGKTRRRNVSGVRSAGGVTLGMDRDGERERESMERLLASSETERGGERAGVSPTSPTSPRDQ